MKILKCAAYAGVTFEVAPARGELESIGTYLTSIASRFPGERELYVSDRYVLVAVNPQNQEFPDGLVSGEACQYLGFVRNDAELKEGLSISRSNPASAGALFAESGKAVLFRGASGAQTSYIASGEKASFFCSNLHFLNNQQLGISRVAIAWYLRYFYVPAPYTIYECLLALQPGECSLLGSTRAQSSLFMAGGSDDCQARCGNESPDAVVKEFERRLEESASAALRSAKGRAGLLLSGGKDSSGLAIVIAKSFPATRCLTVGFPGSDKCEAMDATVVAQSQGLQNEIYEVTPADAVASWRAFCGRLGQPVADPAAYALYLALERKFSEYDVLLDGTGNDSYFGLFPGLRSRMTWRLRRKLWSMGCDFVASSFSKALNLKNKKLELPAQEFYVSWNGYPPDAINNMFEESLDWERLPLYKLYSDCSTPTAHMTRTVCGIWEPEAAYRKLVQFSALLGKTIYYPFLDPRLRQLVLASPPDCRYSKGQSKVLLLQMLRQHLPKEVLNKPKGAFVFPLLVLMNVQHNPEFEEFFNRNEWVNIGLENVWEGVRFCLDGFRGGDMSKRGRVYALFVLFTWLRMENGSGLCSKRKVPQALKSVLV